MFAGLRKPVELTVIVVTLLAYGCPLQAIVHAFGLDERTVADWRDRAGIHCEKVHKDKLEKGNIDLKHVQADEIRVKDKGNILWMALAIMVPTRLWLAGTVSETRDRKLTACLMQQVRRSCQVLSTLLVCTDGFAAYPNSIRRAFRLVGEEHNRKRKMLFRGLERFTYRYRYQKQDASERSTSRNGSWKLGTSAEPFTIFTHVEQSSILHLSSV